ncbi:MAG TPA: LPS export ABC transporter permease LptG [Caulobacteraceae bacterium]|nr:LPS export ABC transporter permease LptG [Caulobacteraceae bacterium]
MRLRFGRIETYVMGYTLLAVLAALAILTTVVALVDFVELSRTVGNRVDVSYNEVLRLTALNLPSIILVLLPFAFLFGVLGAFVDLNRKSELIAMRAAGVSAWRFILPAAGAAFVIGIVSVTLFNPLASTLNAQFERERNALVEGVQSQGLKDIWLRQGDANTRIVIRAHAGDDDHGTLRLRGVSLFISTVSGEGSAQFSRRVEAAQAWLMPGHWLLTGAREATPGSEALNYDTLSIPSSLDGHNALERYASPKAVPFWSLWGAIARTEQAGFSATGYRLQLQELLATPLLFAAMSILAAAFSLRLIRLGGVATLAGAGVALGFGLFFFNQFCGALGEANAIPPFAAAWTPPVIALLSGFTLLCYTEDG